MKTQVERRKEERNQAREQMIAMVQRETKCTEKEARMFVNLGLPSIEAAKEVIESDKSAGTATAAEKAQKAAKKAVAATKKKGIQEDELTDLAELVKKHFPDKQFKNADLSKHLGELPYEMTARQTPSRLKRLVEMGVLESEDAKPSKLYKLK